MNQHIPIWYFQFSHAGKQETFANRYKDEDEQWVDHLYHIWFNDYGTLKIEY